MVYFAGDEAIADFPDKGIRPIAASGSCWQISHSITSSQEMHLAGGFVLWNRALYTFVDRKYSVSN